jgi:phospholipid/cholesterol/gamma-HCH transport system ATP-binding protein
MVRPSRTSIMLDAKTMVPGEPFIEFKDVRLGFDDGEVLRGVSFDVSAGETKVILGESGSGKTLLMKLAAGLLRPDSGRVWVMGHHLGEMSEEELLDFRRHLGFVFQEGALFDSMTVAENVAFRLREENAAEEEIEQRVREALRFVELEQALDKFPAELSGGMRRRVSIARALVSIRSPRRPSSRWCCAAATCRASPLCWPRTACRTLSAWRTIASMKHRSES